MDLQEYGTRQGVALSSDQVSSLLKNLPWLKVSPSREGVGLFDLKADSYVGACDVGDFSLRVLPKFDISNLPFLLGFSRERARRWPALSFGFGSAQVVSNLVTPGFVDAAERALSAGVLNGYRTTQESLATVRGRVDFTAQCQRRFGRILPVEVEYQDFTDDILENRLLQAAALRLRRIGVHDERLLRRLRRIETLLQNVTPTVYDPRAVPEVRFHRLNERYRDAAQTSRLVLANATLDLKPGPARLKSFFVNMNYAFEDYVVRSLRSRLQLGETEFIQGGAGGRKLYLDAAESVVLEPDFHWWKGTRCVAVGDVKYKRPDQKDQGDLYQLEAYLLASGVSRGFLVYGEAVIPYEHAISNTNKVIKIRGIDLSVEPRDIELQLESLAREIRSDADQLGSPGVPDPRTALGNPVLR